METALTSEKMTLQMLRVEVSLGAVRARELPVGILLGDLGLGSASSGGGRRRTSRSTRKNTTSSLRTDHMSGLFAVGREHRWLRHQRALAVGRVHARLGHLTSSGHGPEDRGDTPAGRRRGRNGLRMNSRSRGLGHHGRRGRVTLLRLLLLVRVVRHHLVAATAGVLAGRRRRVRSHVLGDRCIGARSSRAVLVATVSVLLLHHGMARLERGQLVLELMRRDG